MRLVVVTGVSGAGKSTALRALEDLGYYCADNLPMPLLPKFVELLAARVVHHPLVPAVVDQLPAEAQLHEQHRVDVAERAGHQAW